MNRRLYRYIIPLVLLLSFTAISQNLLYVFYPTTLRPHILQEKLSEVIKGCDITVFARHSDFIAKIEADQPDAVLCHPQVLSQIELYHQVLEGARNGRLKEKYLLVSSGQPTDSLKPGMTIGAVDFLGRSGMKKFLAEILDLSVKYKKVTKFEDLIQLMNFNMVQAAVVPENAFQELARISELDLNKTEITAKSHGIVTFGMKNKKESTDFISKCEINNSTVNDYLGIQEWKKVQ